MRRLIAIALTIVTPLALFPAVPAQAQWVLLARRAIGRVEKLAQGGTDKQSGYDVATVILDANADKVFRTAVDALRKNPALTIVTEDHAARKVEFSNGQRQAGITVTALGDKLSQLLVASTVLPGESSATSIVVDGVLRVCAQMKVHCSEE